jgi:hypothetical protein
MKDKIYTTTEFGKLVNRLSKIGYDVKFTMNYPWIYLQEVNGIAVQQKRNSEHGFCFGYFTASTSNTTEFNFDNTDLKELFNLLKIYKLEKSC